MWQSPKNPLFLKTENWIYIKDRRAVYRIFPVCVYFIWKMQCFLMLIKFMSRSSLQRQYFLLTFYCIFPGFCLLSISLLLLHSLSDPNYPLSLTRYWAQSSKLVGNGSAEISGSFDTRDNILRFWLCVVFSLIFKLKRLYNVSIKFLKAKHRQFQ